MKKDRQEKKNGGHPAHPFFDKIKDKVSKWINKHRKHDEEKPTPAEVKPTPTEE
jgi:hypothetical protein